jgi:hypothetical protein
MAITFRGRGFPLKLTCTDHEILAYLDGTLFATIGTGTKGGEATVLLPGLDSSGLAAYATSASNSDKLDGYDATNFITSGGSAGDSARFVGNLPTNFITSGGSAGDSARLAGYLPTNFMTSGGSASDSALLSGAAPTTFALVNATRLFTGEISGNASLVFGTYVACGAASAAGRIAIKDAGGTVRYLLCTNV